MQTEQVADEARARALATLSVPPFEAIYVEYLDFVWSSARYFGVKRAAMDDVVQEIFMVIHRKIATLRRPEALRSWIYGIVRRTVINYLRTQRRRNASDIVLSLHVETQKETQPTPLELAEQKEAENLLWGLLNEIDVRKREVLMLVELHGMTAPEISSGLAIPLNTVYTRLRMARAAFDAALLRRIARERSRGHA